MKTFEHNVLTNEIIERDLTEEELAQQKIDLAEWEQVKQANADKLAAKESAEAKLAALGLTADEIAAIA